MIDRTGGEDGVNAMVDLIHSRRSRFFHCS